MEGGLLHTTSKSCYIPPSVHVTEKGGLCNKKNPRIRTRPDRQNVCTWNVASGSSSVSALSPFSSTWTRPVQIAR